MKARGDGDLRPLAKGHARRIDKEEIGRRIGRTEAHEAIDPRRVASGYPADHVGEPSRRGDERGRLRVPHVKHLKTRPPVDLEAKSILAL